jgi:hypothetical protein
MEFHDSLITSQHADAMIALPALPGSACAGRRFIKTVLAIREVYELEDDALLCTSELVTNSVAATASMSPASIVVLCTSITERKLRIEVWDDSASLPALRRPTDEEEHGRGLVLVSTVCDRWGSDLLAGSHARGPCKVTWCEWDRVGPSRVPAGLPPASNARAVEQPTPTAEVHSAHCAGRATAVRLPRFP